MILTERQITIRDGKSTINEPVILYRGDYEVSIKFAIMDFNFSFESGVNLVYSEKASYGQLAILAPYGGNVFSDVVECEDGTVTLTLTEEIIDQLEEVGLYSFQIRLYDHNKEARVSTPPVEFGIEVREPVASEDHDNEVNNAIVGYSIAKVVDGLNENIPDTFDDDGNYNKTEWGSGDRISQGKLNKIEDAIDVINKNEKLNSTTLNKQMTNNFNVLQQQITNNENQHYQYLITVPHQESVAEKFTGTKIAADDRIITYNTLISYYDDIADDYPNYITKTTVGKSSGGAYNIYKYKLKPKSSRMKILIISGVHGSEFVYPFTLFNFIEILCQTDIHNYSYFQEIKENIEFVIVPVVNPHGWNKNTRTNYNDVDINRNFDYKWDTITDDTKGTAPFSENESQYIRDLLNAEKPDFFLDLHNTHRLDYDFYSTYSSKKDISFVIRQVLSMLDQKKKDESGFSKGILLDGTSNTPTSQAYSNNVKFIPAFTMEWVNSSYSDDNRTWYNDIHMTKSLELLVNVLHKVFKFHIETIVRKTQKIIQINMTSGGTVSVANSEGYVKLEKLEYSMVAPYDCVACFSGGVTIMNSATSNVNVFSLLNRTGTVDNNETYANEVYTDYSGRSTLPIFSSFNFKEGDTIKLNLFIKANASTAKMYRYRGLMTLIPDSEREIVSRQL